MLAGTMAIEAMHRRLGLATITGRSIVSWSRQKR